MKKSKLPPGPKARNPLGHLFSFRRDSIGFLKRIASEYGDIVYFKIGPIRLVLLNHPDFIKEVLTTQYRSFVKGRPLEMAKELLGEGLLTSEGEFHKRQSRLIQPAFHRSAIESCATAMTECSLRLMNAWTEGMRVDMKEEMTNMSIAIAGKALFGADLENEAKEINKALETATNLFGRISLPFSELLLKLPIPSTRQFFKAKKTLDDTIYKMIHERQRNKVGIKDLLSLLLDSQEEKEGAGMSKQQVRDEALTLFLTAFDTTSTALTWVWYLLSQHPEVEAELHKELDSVLQGRVPAVEDVPSLKYTRMVLGESMRMYPPTYVIPRQAIEDFSIDKYILPKGTIVLLSPYLIHHDSRFHANPENFDPYAWDKHTRSANSKYEYFPFSRGPRACIGEPFAWMQGILVLASIAQSWRIKLASGHPVELLPLMNLRPKYGMMMTVHQREKV
jgi:cytochrome P450